MVGLQGALRAPPFVGVRDPSPTLPKGKGELSLQAAHCVPERSFFTLIFREKESPFPLGRVGDGCFN